MCGLAGISRSNRSKLTDDQVKIIMSILISRMDDRGGDSFGYYTNGSIVKGIGTGVFSINLDQIKRARSLFLHTRKATVGEITKENAHPWRIENIVGCHNGSVANHHELNKKYNRNFDVDSQHIFAHYSEDLPLSELRAHGAIVFVDELFNKEVLWAGKFNDGILSVVGIGPEGQESEDIVFCSLGPAIKSALDMAKVPDFRSYALDTGHLYQIYQGRLLYNIPNTKLNFSSRTYFNARREYDLSVTDWNFRQTVKKEEKKIEEKTVNPIRRFNYPPLSPVQKNHIAIKGFVRNRLGLEAWYKAGICAHCAVEDATVRVPCTDQLYCQECWIHFEKIAPFMLLKDEYENYFAGDSPLERVEDDPEEEREFCGRCQGNPAVWFAPKLDMCFCNPCRIGEGLTITEIVAMNEKEIILETVSTGQEIDGNSEYPKTPDAKNCMLQCSRMGIHWYRSKSLEKYLWLCTPCFQAEYQSDEQTVFNLITGKDLLEDLSPIRIGFPRPAKLFSIGNGKLSARKPEQVH